MILLLFVALCAFWAGLACGVWNDEPFFAGSIIIVVLITITHLLFLIARGLGVAL